MFAVIKEIPHFGLLAYFHFKGVKKALGLDSGKFSLA